MYVVAYQLAFQLSNFRLTDFLLFSQRLVIPAPNNITNQFS
jgi:hypothetical protein